MQESWRHLVHRPISSYSPFCPKFRSHFNEGQLGWNSIGNIRWPICKLPPPYEYKNLADIFYTNRVITNFLSNFVTMATGVSRGKMRLAAFNGPSPKTPLWAQKYRKNLLRKPSYSQFCPKFRCHGNQGGSEVKLYDTIRFVIPENYDSILYTAKVMTV